MRLQVELFAYVAVVAVCRVLVAPKELGKHVHVSHVTKGFRAIAKLNKVIRARCGSAQKAIRHTLDKRDNLVSRLACKVLQYG